MTATSVFISVICVLTVLGMIVLFFEEDVKRLIGKFTK